jgi:hypothetical protein
MPGGVQLPPDRIQVEFPDGTEADYSGFLPTSFSTTILLIQTENATTSN